MKREPSDETALAWAALGGAHCRVSAVPSRMAPSTEGARWRLPFRKPDAGLAGRGIFKSQPRKPLPRAIARYDGITVQAWAPGPHGGMWMACSDGTFRLFMGFDAILASLPGGES